MTVSARVITPAVVGVQTLLYRTPVEAVERTIAALNNTAEIGKSEGHCSGFVLVLGDASPRPVLSEEKLVELREGLTHIDELHYVFFDENTGTSKGHNRMADWMPTADYLITSNPDVVPEPRAVWRMLAEFADPTVGMVEAKQLPIEHPKEYDKNTGDTPWATTAFAMTLRELFLRMGRFDEVSFFMYCDDLDYSWRLREAGHRVVFQPSAVVFHDKSLTTEGQWMPTAAERKYSAEAALFLAHKWSRPDEVSRILAAFDQSEDEHCLAAAATFRSARAEGRLVARHDRENKIAMFRDDNYYAEHRYEL